MKDIEFLNEVNDRVVLSVDEPIYQSTERFIHTMSEQLELSPQQIKEALEEGLADIVAHPDLFMFGRREWNETCEMATEMICDAALKANAVLEVNLGGIKYGKRTLGKETRLPYPYRRFWEIVERKGN